MVENEAHSLILIHASSIYSLQKALSSPLSSLASSILRTVHGVR